MPIARSLRRQGVRCVVAVPSGQSFTIRSNAISEVVHLPGAPAEAATFLGLLAAAQHATWIAAASDLGLAIIAHACEWLSPVCALACPKPEVVERLLEQSLPGAIAESSGISASGQGSPRERHALPTVTCVSVLMSDGIAQAVFQHKQIASAARMLDGGSKAQSELPDPELVNRSVALLQTLNWSGVAMVEFTRQGPDSDYAVHNVTGRFWSAIQLPISLGVDFPRYAWEISQGIAPTPPPTYEIGRKIERMPLWSRSDPMPAIQEAVASVTNAFIPRTTRANIAATAQRTLDTIRVAQRLSGGRGRRYLARRFMRSLGLQRKDRLPVHVASVLFVCHGNMIRSAAAAQFLSDALLRSGVSHISVTSAGTNARTGSAADSRAQRAALQLGTSLEHHRSQPLTQEIINRADVIFAMDDFNVVNIETDFPQSRGKVHLLGGMNGSGLWEPSEIIDPYSATDAEIALTIASIHRFVAALHAALTRTNDQTATTRASTP